MIIDKIKYYSDLYSRQISCNKICKPHQVKLYNWSKPFVQDLWLIDFIEQRGLLTGKENLRIALYSVFGSKWLTTFDHADMRIFVERENLHKPHFKEYLHRYLDDDRFNLSLGFDEIEHPQYMRFPFWLMWTVFAPTVTYQTVKEFVKRSNSISRTPKTLKFCAYVCSHDDLNRKKIYDEFNSIAPISCPGKLFHNDDSLKTIYRNDKIRYLSTFKFNLTPENSNYPGYVTEKLFEAIAAGAVPIYNGSDNNPEPDIINKDAIIFIELGNDNSSAVNLVNQLQNNDKLYQEFSSLPRFRPNAAEYIWEYYSELETRLIKIIQNL